MRNILRKHFVFIFILAIAAFLRLYRFDDLAIFRADGAIDLLAVVNITQGNFTLLGPQVSVAGFFNGPIVYYLMTPFVFVFGNNPLVGILFQTTLMLFSIVVLYFLGNTIFNRRVALIAIFLAAISPLHITYGRQIFNAYPAVLFSTLILLMLTLLIKKKLTNLQNYIIIFFAGLFSGMIVQMHYLTAFFIILGLLFPILIDKKYKRISFYILFSFGILIGISPYLLFEIRHGFLNTQKAIEYIFSTTTSGSDQKYIVNSISAFPLLINNLITGNSRILSWIISIAGLLFFAKSIINRKAINNESVRLIYLCIFLTFMIVIFYGRFIQTHYIIGMQTLLFLILAFFIYHIIKSKTWLLYIVLSGIVLINAPLWYLHTQFHPLQDSLRVSDFEKTAQYIYKTAENKSYNVTMDAQTDNRAWPVRYLLMLTNRPPQDIYTYGITDYLFVLARKNKPLNKLTMWEFTSFGNYMIKDTTPINDSYVLYQLAKQPLGL